jgi:hypothetical protein
VIRVTLSRPSGYLAINTLSNRYRLEPSCLKGLSATFKVPGICLFDSEFDWHAPMRCRHLPYIHMVQVRRPHPLYSMRKVTPHFHFHSGFGLVKEEEPSQTIFSFSFWFWFSEGGRNVSDHFLFGFSIMVMSL